MARIVVIGSLNMDIVAVATRLPHAGETIIGSQYLNEPGGKGANQAYAAAKLGGEVAMLGQVGTDDHGKRMLANLSAVGCDISGLKTVEGASGVAVIFVAASGENSIVVVPGANDRFRPEDVRAQAHSLANAQLALLQLETPIDTVIAAAQTAKIHGAQVILDPAPAPSSLPQELLQCVDILTPNETEATQLTGNPPGPLTTQEAHAIARQLRASGPRTVIIKLGAQGCVLAEGDVASFIPAPRVNAVDTTAAGDVFNAAFAVACSRGSSRIDACRFAVQAASLSVTRLGAQRGMPGPSELDCFLASNVLRE